MHPSRTGKQMLDLLDEMDQLLNTQHSFLLGKWLKDARAFGKTNAEKKYYEENARVIITTWGRKGQSLNDYASRNWAGLTKTYYRERWKMFIEQVTNAVKNNTAFDENKFHEKVTSFEITGLRKQICIALLQKEIQLLIAGKLVRKYKHLLKYQ